MSKGQKGSLCMVLLDVEKPRWLEQWRQCLEPHFSVFLRQQYFLHLLEILKNCYLKPSTKPDWVLRQFCSLTKLVIFLTFPLKTGFLQNIREINCFIQFHAKICKNVLFAKQIIITVNVFTKILFRWNGDKP